jgi:hypothetical protein
VRVSLRSTAKESDTGFGFAEVSKDGSFELGGITDGGYALAVGGLEQGWFVKSARLGSEDVLLKGVQVENNAVAGRLEVVASADGGQIEGTVTDSDKNSPLSGVQLRASPEPESDFNHFRSRQSATDQNGHFVLKDVPPGKYKVSAKMPSSGGGAPKVKSDPVAVSVGERERRVLDIQLKVPKSE